MMKGKRWVFQQDGAPAHTAKSTQEWLSVNVPEFLSREEWCLCLLSVSLLFLLVIMCDKFLHSLLYQRKNY